MGAAFGRLTPRLMLQLAAMHTWPASIFPVLVATALALLWAQGANGTVSVLMVLVLLAIAVAMQSAVNAINDYFDYVKGTDTVDNQDDPTDAVLVYNNVNPASVRNFAIALLALAFALGIYCVYVAGPLPLGIACLGAVVIFLYSGGKTPISYLPIGEAVSGITMGGLILVASYYCLTLSLNPLLAIWCVPVVLGIALIMFTNNGCDIEKDRLAGRKTLPVVLGHDKALCAYHGVVYTWVASVVAIVGVFFTRGLVVVPFMLLAIHPIGRALLANPLTAQSRQAAFAQCTSLNVALGSFYAVCILAEAFPLGW